MGLTTNTHLNLGTGFSLYYVSYELIEEHYDYLVEYQIILS